MLYLVLIKKLPKTICLLKFIKLKAQLINKIIIKIPNQVIINYKSDRVGVRERGRVYLKTKTNTNILSKKN